MRVWPLLTLLALCAAPCCGAISLVDVVTDDQDAVQRLVDHGLDVWEVDGKRIRVLVGPEERRWLISEGFAVEKAPDFDAVAASTPDRLAVDGFYTFAEFEATMASWAAANPDTVTLTSLGRSWENRDIWLLKISDNAAVDEDEPEVLMLALQHAREWLSGMTLHGILNHLITQHGVDAVVTDLVDTMEIFAVLVANPDGYVYTFTPGNRLWRPNRNPSGGVDLNRNWGWEWNGGGAAPYSEPETQALRAWVLSRGGALVGCLNYHTYGTRVMHSWAHTFDLPPNVDLMGPLARDVAFAIEAVNGQRMRNGSWAITLDYTGGGTTNDEFHAALGIPTLTIELRPGDGATGGFAPPGTSIAPSVSENIAGAIHFLQWARAQANDPTPPVISDLSVTDISSDRATVTWRTDEGATRAVEWGLSTAYGSSVEPDRLRGLTHSVTVAGLAPATTYHVRAVAQNLAGLISTSADTVFATTATPQDITPPAAPALDWVRLAAPGTAEIAWTALESEPLAGHRLYESADGETWSLLLDESVLTAGLTTHQFPAPPPGATRLYRLTNVDMAPRRNESAPSDVYGLLTRGGPAEVLIVDGFDRWNNKPIAQGLNHRFAGDHALAVGAFGTPLETCRNEMVGAGIDLLDYSTVLWVLGDESTGTETFSDDEQAALRAFLEGGGNLFVSGSNVAYDLGRPTGPSATDRLFLNSYLCADYAGDDMDDYDVQGAGGTSIFGTRLVRFDEGSRGIYRVDDPDSVVPLSGAVSALRSPAGEICGVQREGLFGAGTVPGRVVYLAFPFETIFPASAREEVMRDVLTFFSASVSAELTGFMTR